MFSRSYLADRLFFLFIVGLVLLQYPVLSILNIQATIAGIPILFFYLFVVWALFIIFLAILIEARQRRKSEDILSEK